MVLYMLLCMVALAIGVVDGFRGQFRRLPLHRPISLKSAVLADLEGTT